MTYKCTNSMPEYVNNNGVVCDSKYCHWLVRLYQCATCLICFFPSSILSKFIFIISYKFQVIRSQRRNIYNGGSSSSPLCIHTFCSPLLWRSLKVFLLLLRKAADFWNLGKVRVPSGSCQTTFTFPLAREYESKPSVHVQQ